MLRARFLPLIMSHAWAGNRTRVGGVTGERANHYTTAPLSFDNSRLAHRVIAHVTCLPTKLLGESGQQITLAFLPSGWISVLLLILGPPTFQIT